VAVVALVALEEAAVLADTDRRYLENRLAAVLLPSRHYY
jgi:hypothetical protein